MRCFPGVCANTFNVRRQWKLVHMCWEESRASQKILDRYHVIQQEKHLCHFLGKTFETYPSCKTSIGSRTDPGVARIDRNVRQREALEVFDENCSHQVCHCHTMTSGVRHSHYQHLAINEIGTGKFAIASPASPSTMYRWASDGTEVQAKKKGSEKRQAGVLETGAVRRTPGSRGSGVDESAATAKSSSKDEILGEI